MTDLSEMERLERAATPDLAALLAAAIHEYRRDVSEPPFDYLGDLALADAILATPSGKALASHFEREAAYQEALGFYADPETWRPRVVQTGGAAGPATTADWLGDRGARARAALQAGDG